MKNNKAPVRQGATAPQLPPSTMTGSQIAQGVLPERNVSARREYVALGGSRKAKKGKGRKSKKSKSKKSKSKKSKRL